MVLVPCVTKTQNWFAFKLCYVSNLTSKNDVMTDGPVRFFFLFFFMCLWYGLLVAQIWQTVADCQSAIISCGTWAGWTCPVQFCYVGSSFMFIVLYYMLFCVAGLIKISWIGLKFLGRSQSLKISDMSDRSMRETLKKKKILNTSRWILFDAMVQLKSVASRLWVYHLV